MIELPLMTWCRTRRGRVFHLVPAPFGYRRGRRIVPTPPLCGTSTHHYWSSVHYVEPNEPGHLPLPECRRCLAAASRAVANRHERARVPR